MLTQWHIVIRLYLDVLSDFHVVYILQDGQPVTNARNAHLLQLVMLQSDQGVPHNAVFCTGLASASASAFTEQRTYL
jgi:hypothetical protein